MIAFKAYQRMLGTKETGENINFTLETPRPPQWGTSHPIKGLARKVPYSDKERAIFGVAVDRVNK